jgi:sensor histidine kinase YesM
MEVKTWKFYGIIWLVFHVISCSISYGMRRGNQNWSFDYFQNLFALPNILFLLHTMAMSFLIIEIGKRFMPQKPLLYFLIMSLPLFCISLIWDYWTSCVIQNCEIANSFLNFFNRRSIVNGLILIFGMMVKFFLDYLKTDDMKTKIIAEKNAIELAFLKSQINPHFLFNTLNNLYGLSLSEPDKTPDAILKLAEMMRYMLYESNTERVPLHQEIAYLKSFIELQKLRYDGVSFIHFEVNGILSTQQIAPLLLISFVENAFKHGDVYDAQYPLHMSLSFDRENLVFEVKNKIHRQNKDSVGGVGIKNVERRLELLYPKKHLLTVENDLHYFESHLEIEL